MSKSIKNTLSILVILLLISITSIITVNAATGLNVVLSSQNPDPVEPGNFVYINVKISNSGSDSISSATMSMIENANFKVAKGEDIQKILGVIPAYSSTEGSNSFVIAKYKIFVDDNTPTGLNTLTFKINSNIGEYEYDFDILVQDNNPLIEIEDLDIEQIQPGASSTLTIKLKNINTVDLKNVKVALNLAEVEDKVITMSSSSNEEIIDILKSQESNSIEFQITISPDANSIPYLIPIILTYKDTLGNSFENTVYGSVQVYSPPSLSLNIDSQDIYTTGKGKVSLAIANPGSSKIKGVQIQILSSDDYEIIEGENQYIGDLNPDDFQTLPTQIYIKNEQQSVLKVKLTYFDSYDKPSEEIIEIPLKIYNSEELSQFGFSNGASSTNVTGYIIVLIIGIIIGYVAKRRKIIKNNK